MEKDNTQYFNDEWNLKPSDIIEKYYKVLNKEGKPQDIVLRESDKEFINNSCQYRQLTCHCNLPRPNSFTGNCTNCNKIIKPIIDKDADKYTK